MTSPDLFGAPESAVMDLRVAAYAVIVGEQGLLLAHWNERGRSGWTLPGGGIDPGEDPADAAVREVKEETGYHAVLDDLLGIDSLVTAAQDRLGAHTVHLHSLRIIYRAHLTGGSLRNEVQGSTDEARWIPLQEIDELDRVSLVDAARRLAGIT